MSTPAVTRPGRPRARFALSRRWRRPVVAGLLIAGLGAAAAGVLVAARRRLGLTD